MRNSCKKILWLLIFNEWIYDFFSSSGITQLFMMSKAESSLNFFGCDLLSNENAESDTAESKFKGSETRVRVAVASHLTLIFNAVLHASFAI